MPIIDTWRAMEECVDRGLTKHIGVSNFNIPKLKNLVKAAQIVPEMNQVESHPLLAQEELLEYCKENGIHLTAYSPLGSRDRHPSMKDGEEPDLFENPTLKRIASERGVHPAQILIKWAEARGTSVIPKSTNPERLKQNLEAANLELGDDDMTAIARLDMNYRFINGKFFRA